MGKLMGGPGLLRDIVALLCLWASLTDAVAIKFYNGDVFAELRSEGIIAVGRSVPVDNVAVDAADESARSPLTGHTFQQTQGGAGQLQLRLAKLALLDANGAVLAQEAFGGNNGQRPQFILHGTGDGYVRSSVLGVSARRRDMGYLWEAAGLNITLGVFIFTRAGRLSPEQLLRGEQVNAGHVLVTLDMQRLSTSDGDRCEICALAKQIQVETGVAGLAPIQLKQQTTGSTAEAAAGGDGSGASAVLVQFGNQASLMLPEQALVNGLPRPVEINYGTSTDSSMRSTFQVPISETTQSLQLAGLLKPGHFVEHQVDDEDDYYDYYDDDNDDDDDDDEYNDEYDEDEDADKEDAHPNDRNDGPVLFTTSNSDYEVGAQVKEGPEGSAVASRISLSLMASLLLIIYALTVAGRH